MVSFTVNVSITPLRKWHWLQLLSSCEGHCSPKWISCVTEIIFRCLFKVKCSCLVCVYVQPKEPWLFRRMQGNRYVWQFLFPHQHDENCPFALHAIQHLLYNVCYFRYICALFSNQHANYSTQVKGHFHTLCSTTIERRERRANYISSFEYGVTWADTMFLTWMVLEGQIESIIIHICSLLRVK